VKIALVDELPRNATGKILRRNLVQFFQPEAKEMAS
jgi:long-chain acyl-CoA synthetase